MPARKHANDTAGQNRRRNKRRVILHGLKADAGCMFCAEQHPACLQFHHRDPSEKEHKVNRMLSQNASMGTMLAEISKCDVVCANCHAKLHWAESEKRNVP